MAFTEPLPTLFRPLSPISIHCYCWPGRLYTDTSHHRKRITSIIAESLLSTIYHPSEPESTSSSFTPCVYSTHYICLSKMSYPPNERRKLPSCIQIKLQIQPNPNAFKWMNEGSTVSMNHPQMVCNVSWLADWLCSVWICCWLEVGRNI